jgi:hypothetical protein
LEAYRVSEEIGKVSQDVSSEKEMPRSARMQELDSEDSSRRSGDSSPEKVEKFKGKYQPWHREVLRIPSQTAPVSLIDLATTRRLREAADPIPDAPEFKK